MTSTTHASTPEPDLSFVGSRDVLVIKTGDELLNENFLSPAVKKSVRRNLHSYSDELLHTLRSVLVTDKTERQGTEYGYKLRAKVVSGDKEASFWEALYFYPLLTGRSNSVTAKMLHALHLYPQLPASDDYSSESPEVIAKCTALLKVTDVLSDLSGGIDSDWVIANRTLAELVLAHPDCADQIADFIEARETADPELVQAMLDSESPALAEGVL